MNDLWIPLLPFAAFLAWLFFFGMGRRKACPNCNQWLPRIQSPLTKTKRQWLEGGYVCQNCGCEADIAGNEVPAGVVLQRRSIITWIGLLTLAVVLGLILLTVLLYR